MSFRNKINSSIQEAKKVLGTARSPCIPTDQSHVYDDKYLLAEIGTRTTLLAVRNTLDQATNNTFTMNLDKMVAWARAGKTVTLCTEAEELCSFVNTTEREVKSTTSRVTEKTGVFGNKSKREEYTITKVTEHTWEYQINWETYVYPADELEQVSASLSSRLLATNPLSFFSLTHGGVSLFLVVAVAALFHACTVKNCTAIKYPCHHPDDPR